MKKKFYAFVSYTFQSETGWGFGNTTQFLSNRKYVSAKEILEMQDVIKKDNGYTNVVIMNYKFM